MATNRLRVVHVDRLLSVLSDVAAEWTVFMGQLGLPQAQISQIERDTPPGDGRSVECLRTALLHWVRSGNKTYNIIVSALRRPILNNATLAHKVEEFSLKVQGL